MKVQTLLLVVILISSQALAKGVPTSGKPVKVFLLAGDENVLEQGVVEGRTDGIHDGFFPNAEPVKDELRKHVNCAVYKGDYSKDADYDKLTPVATTLVEVGDPRTRRIDPKKRGLEPVPMTPFPEVSGEEGYTTVLRGYVTVQRSGKYEFLAGKDEVSFNVTTVQGEEVYRRNPGEQKAAVVSVQLEPGRRYAFRTIFFGTPGHDFRIPLVNKPGALSTVVDANPRYAFLRGKDGRWISRDDVVLYDAHPLNNNTEAPAKPLEVGTMVRNGGEGGHMMGVDLMLGHTLGDAIEEPVMLLRFGVRHPIWFLRGSRDLAHSYRPPSSGGGSDLDGNWDVIHFNFGVWDATYRDASSKYFSGHNTTSVEDFEKNLRTLVARMRKTGATLIWGSVTPVWEGTADKPSGDEDAYNAVAAKVMQENGVIINDLNAEARRMGYPKSKDVHSVGNLAPKVTSVIIEALNRRQNSTKPLPRVLLIGDSITGSYQNQVFKDLDGKAAVFKNPGNAEDTWNGLERIDEWLDIQRYLLNGQEYLELVDGVRKAMGVEFDRVFPGQAGRGAELAGMVWFHGIADSQSPSKAAEYDVHLANLIRDIRKDLDAPQLPFVVAALASSRGSLTANEQKVFDAQMAVGNKETYPEFSNTVISIDTQPMVRPPALSPGGRDGYLGNAQSYLEIGEAMGKAMLELLKGPQ